MKLLHHIHQSYQKKYIFTLNIQHTERLQSKKNNQLIPHPTWKYYISAQNVILLQKLAD